MMLRLFMSGLQDRQGEHKAWVRLLPVTASSTGIELLPAVAAPSSAASSCMEQYEQACCSCCCPGCFCIHWHCTSGASSQPAAHAGPRWRHHWHPAADTTAADRSQQRSMQRTAYISGFLAQAGWHAANGCVI